MLNSQSSVLTCNSGAYEAANTISLFLSKPVINAASPAAPDQYSQYIIASCTTGVAILTAHSREGEPSVGDAAIEVVGVSRDGCVFSLF